MYTGSFLVQGLFFRTFLHMASAEVQVYSMIVTQPWKVGLGWLPGKPSYPEIVSDFATCPWEQAL